MRQVSLDARIEDLVWPGVAERRAVLVQEIHQLLGYDPAKQKQKHMNLERTEEKEKRN